MNDPRIIKKYPNRRLYDTAESRYITLEDVRSLVLKGKPFTVIDKSSGEDITRTILLQIIIEQEEGGEPIFSTEILKRFINLYGNSVQGLASRFLDDSMDLFREQQELCQARLNEALTFNPLNTVAPLASSLTEMTEKNLKLWQEMQEKFFNTATTGGWSAAIPPGASPSADAGGGSRRTGEDLDATKP